MKAMIVATLVVLGFVSAGLAQATSPAPVHKAGPKYCPGHAGKTWNAKPAILGKSLNVARKIAARHDCEVRVTRQDGEWLAVTADYSDSRLNVGIVGPKKLITQIFNVG